MVTAGPLIDIEKAGITTLIEFARQASLADDDSLLSLKEECVIVKHTLSLFNVRIAEDIETYRKLVEASDTLKSRGNKDEARQAKAAASTRLNNLIILQGELRGAVLEVSRVVKAAAEIEALKATRFDSLQLLQLLQQVPALLTEIISETLAKRIDELGESLSSATVGLGGKTKKDILSAITRSDPLVSREPALREVSVNDITQEIATELSNRLNGLRVVYNKDTFGGAAGAAGGTSGGLTVEASLIRRQVVAMENTVPGPPAK